MFFAAQITVRVRIRIRRSLGYHSILIRVLPPSFLATAFYGSGAFNGDLSQWDVSKVTTMESSKSIRIVENDLK